MLILAGGIVLLIAQRDRTGPAPAKSLLSAPPNKATHRKYIFKLAECRSLQTC